MPPDQNEVSSENLREFPNYFYKPSVDATEDALFQTIHSFHDSYVQTTNPLFTHAITGERRRALLRYTAKETL